MYTRMLEMVYNLNTHLLRERRKRPPLGTRFQGACNISEDASYNSIIRLFVLSQLNDEDYLFYAINCESFAKYIRYGKWIRNGQVKDLFIMLLKKSIFLLVGIQLDVIWLYETQITYSNSKFE